MTPLLILLAALIVIAVANRIAERREHHQMMERAKQLREFLRKDADNEQKGGA